MTTITASPGFLDGFVSSFSMILVSEIGDKTFFIACLMAMRHPRLTVYVGAVSALAAMTVLSSLMGVAVPNVLSVRVTQMLAVCLFFLFGGKILYDELIKSKDGDEDSDDERAEAEAVLRRKDPKDAEETGSVGSSVYMSSSARRWRRIFSPVMVEAFTLTFVAEWGDRSQLATIALAAAKNPYAVTLGGVLGHATCTAGAVIGGQLIADRVSMKTVNIIGGILFILFGVGTLMEIVNGSSDINDTHATKKA
ncbi:membrane protein [Strigomonas culicis]|uniref:GDT1 family protein n=1 Tax=Strigomonas culicis TaxID=28005 RepID=S9V4L1_9TRYP|nr:membrane protein [Strigomonas culicis]EPY35818.1 membrane protein [Strigomonas culicis]|eukprot:EPY24423.1 membrane protein [Strigomonas culicis]